MPIQQNMVLYVHAGTDPAASTTRKDQISSTRKSVNVRNFKALRRSKRTPSES